MTKTCNIYIQNKKTDFDTTPKLKVIAFQQD